MVNNEEVLIWSFFSFHDILYLFLLEISLSFMWEGVLVMYLSLAKNLMYRQRVLSVTHFGRVLLLNIWF